ncbi:uncharacterized protein [Littorina saxatilis]|uniref:Uncharacterized protein n=1 Tax=Littorina saxatilis TaxID=31220 RepID=A0AAN9C2P4_9CAEN
MASPTAEPETSTGVPSAEAEGVMSASIPELLFPPLSCLACVCAGLLIWVLVVRCKSKKKTIHINSKVNHRDSCGSLHGNGCRDNHIRISHTFEKTDNRLFELKANKLQSNTFSTEESSTESTNLKPLFESNDLEIIQHIQGQGPINGRELLNILMPVIFSLGFCPLTLLLHRPIIHCLWPPSVYTIAPNINDAIACFLVPAGMVYAISFGFAFQQVIGAFGEIQIGVQRRAEQLQKLLTLISHLTSVTMASRLAMLRIVKDVTLTSASKMIGCTDHRSNSKDLEDLLRLLYITKVKDTPEAKDRDLWQRSVFDRLEKVLLEDDLLSSRIVTTRIHGLQWAFLETLGYLTFLGMLLVQCSSYRAELAVCLVTVISISLLCYIVADLDSPFYGVFRVHLDCICDVIRRLDDAFNETAAAVMLEMSISDFEEGRETHKKDTHERAKRFLKI